MTNEQLAAMYRREIAIIKRYLEMPTEYSPRNWMKQLLATYTKRVEELTR